MVGWGGGGKGGWASQERVCLKWHNKVPPLARRSAHEQRRCRRGPTAHHRCGRRDGEYSSADIGVHHGV